MALLIGMASFVVAMYAIWYSLRKRSMHVFFWLCACYFYYFPLLIDTAAVALFGYHGLTGIGLDGKYIGNAASIEQLPYTTMAVLGLLFAVLYFATQRILWRDNWSTAVTEEHHGLSLKAVNYLLLIDVLMLVVFFAFNTKTWFSTSFFVAQSPMARLASDVILVLSALSIPSYRNKLWWRCALFLALPVCITLGTSQRPWAIGSVGCITYIFLLRATRARVLRKRYVFLLGIVGIILIAGLRVARHGLESVSLLGLLFKRDPSYFSMLYVFAHADQFEGLTHGRALAFMLESAWIPDAINVFRATKYSSVDIPLMVATGQMGWQNGSVHPTFIGWGFVDLGNMVPFLGVIFAGGYSAAVSMCSRICRKYMVALVPIIASSSALITRGTVQRGWSDFVFLTLCVLFVGAVSNLSTHRAAWRRGSG